MLTLRRVPPITTLNLPPIVLESQKIEPPGKSKVRGSDPGARAATAYGVMRHSRGMIDSQPPLSRDAWKTEIYKMRSAYGSVWMKNWSTFSTSTTTTSRHRVLRSNDVRTGLGDAGAQPEPWIPKNSTYTSRSRPLTASSTLVCLKKFVFIPAHSRAGLANTKSRKSRSVIWPCSTIS